MNKQELITIRKIKQESDNVFDDIFDEMFIKYNVEVEYFEQHNNFILHISYTFKNNVTFYIKCSVFLHPQGGLQFSGDIYFKNNNPAPDENYYKDSFWLKDYTTFRKIPFDFPQLIWKPVKNYEEGEQAAKKLFEYVKEILLLDEMQKILFTDYWVNVPIDYSPYK